MIQADSRSWRTRKTILVVDDHPIIRRGICALVTQSTSHEVVGYAEDGFEAIEHAEAIGPDIVVMDLSMSRLGGIETIAEIRRRLPDVEILVFTLHQSDHLLAESLKAGARAYVCKSETDHFIPALEAVARHDTYFSPGVSGEICDEKGEEAWDRRPLTQREREIVRLVAEGYSNKEISHLLNISTKTTETHRSSAMRKTGTRSTAALTLYAARNKLVDL